MKNLKVVEEKNILCLVKKKYVLKIPKIERSCLPGNAVSGAIWCSFWILFLSKTSCPLFCHLIGGRYEVFGGKSMTRGKSEGLLKSARCCRSEMKKNKITQKQRVFDFLISIYFYSLKKKKNLAKI